MTETPLAIDVQDVSFAYSTDVVLDHLSFTIPAGSITALLGPNGSGKSTLFRLLATLLPIQQGRIHLCGMNVAQSPALVRRAIGVTFQSPALDGRLTVDENLTCHGQLYGLAGQPLRTRIDDVLVRLGLADRARQFVEQLSGGLKRRVEIAKALLPQPRLLLLDEPSTGLDPAARLDFWQALEQARRDDDVTILVTTHLMDEAEKCDRVLILDRGRIVADGAPQELRGSLGGERVTIVSPRSRELAQRLQDERQLASIVSGQEVRLDATADPLTTLRQLLEDYAADITSLTLARPTLEDVFLHRTGRRFED